MDQHCFFYQWSWPEDEVCPAGIRPCDLGVNISSAKPSQDESMLVSSSSPDINCFRLADEESVEVKNEDWMQWLAKDLCDREVWSNDCESSESSEMAGSASSSEDLARPDLVNLLFGCAKSVQSEENEKAAKDLAELRMLSSPLGDSTQRTVSYFVRGLSRDREIMDPGEMAVAYRALNEACPYFNFAHLTANQAILESMENTDKIHIIDFGMRHGVQWAGLLQALASRPQGKPRSIKISGLPFSSEASSEVLATGKRLTDFASMLGLELQFNPAFTLVEDLEEDYSVFKIEDEECVAVNFMLSLSQLPETAVVRAFKLVRSLKAKIITLTEYELSCGFEEAFHYFSAIFESLEAKFSSNCVERVKAEKLLFAENICRVIAGLRGNFCLRTTEKWRSTMELDGFECCNASRYAVSQAKILLWNYSDKFRVVECRGCVSLAWQDRPLVTVSSWTC
ncbi:hypothetical protein KI387_028446 [Taxus chinensis]|uniref:Uncharacterized protein n=1 Tax=Taxus chinensis TaxID=29808 RepID=A0AA38CFD5_TAXCH|nr:hypothetical protein KI387_028446 [Taxus chinensis]